jgi:putative tricarboxylic transport membrane protein
MFVETADDDASEGGLESPWRLVGAVAATAAYLVAFERLGYLLATPVYVVAILLLQPGVRARAFVAAPVLVTLALYAAFRFGLLIPVPDGLLESWLPW